MLAFLGAFLKRFRRSSAPTTTPISSALDTEFTAEVVRITQVIPHGNADKLEIARFEMRGIGETSYEVVVGKGTVAVDDLAAYLSVDCIVPTAHPAFEFLTKRLDGAGKTHYRLKAARLRGVYSQGLLVALKADEAKDISHLQFGDSVASLLGITYHRPNEPGESQGPTAPSGKKPLSQPMAVYGVDSLKKSPRLFEEGEPVVISEKIHGTNFRFGWVPRKLLGVRVGWKFVVGSHRVIKGQGGDNHWYRDADGVGEDLWMQAAQRMKLAEKTKGFKGHAFYGELFGHTYTGGKIQDLTYGRKSDEGPSLAIFDVKMHAGDRWLTYDERQALLGAVGLPSVPILTIAVPWSPDLLTMAEGKSTLDKGTIREGIVVESMTGARRKAKFVSQGYLLRKEA